MYELLVLVFLMQFVVLVFLYCTDRELKCASGIGVKDVEMLTLAKSKYLFVYYRRKTGIISKHALIRMAMFYLINFAGLITVLVQIAVGGASSLTITYSVFCILNMGLLVAVLPNYALNAEERKRMLDYHQKIHEEYWKRKKRKG